jgi:hypothetical protein
LAKALTRALLVAALSSASTLVFADGSGIPYYARGPRIIHVPQPGDDLRDSRASLRDDAPEDLDDDAVQAEPPRGAVKRLSRTESQQRPKTPYKTQAKTVARASVHQEPRRRPFSVSVPEPPPPPPAEPLGPRRALLSAPPPPPVSSIHDGPTPIRPTPRFGLPLPEPAAPATTEDAATASDSTASASTDVRDDHLPPPGDPRLAPPEPKS